MNRTNPESKRNYCHEIVDEWKAFANDIAPANDSAAEYCATHPLYIPLFKELFETIDENSTRQEQQCHDNDIPVDVLFQECSMVASRRKRSSNHPANSDPILLTVI